MHWFRIAIKSCPCNYFAKGFRTCSIALSVTLIQYAIVQMWHGSTQLQFTPLNIQKMSVTPVLWWTTLFNWIFQIHSIEPQMQVFSAWLTLLLPIGWLTLGKWCWLAVTICAIFPLLGGLLSVFVSKCSSELQLLWIRMLCYILLRSYIQCCTLNWINLMYGFTLNHIPFGLIYFTYGLHSLIYGHRTYHYWSQMEFNSG